MRIYLLSILKLQGTHIFMHVLDFTENYLLKLLSSKTTTITSKGAIPSAMLPCLKNPIWQPKEL